MMKKAVAVALTKNNSVLFQLRDNKTTIMPQLGLTQWRSQEKGNSETSNRARA